MFSCFSPLRRRFTTSIFYCSFQKGDVFLVENVIDNDWLWVVAQKDEKSGLVPKALTEELVSITAV